jgi:thiol-disulfide isomerase/thioredoxin
MTKFHITDPWLRHEGHMPPLDGATAWLNSPPLTTETLRGRVVLVDFWTYTCINWLRTLPYVRAWAKEYEPFGLVVIGVHTPEFGIETDLDNVRRAVREMRIEYPVAVDSDFAIWQAFANHDWPALYFVDAKGAIRHHHFGEGEYERSERVIHELLDDAGAGAARDRRAKVEAKGIEIEADWDNLGSPETYLGYERAEQLASAGGAEFDARHAYAVPDQLDVNEWALGGDWTIGREKVVAHDANTRIVYRFHARDLHLILAPPASGGTARFRVRIDGEPPGAARGLDVDAEGNGTIVEPRLYQLVRQPGRVTDHDFEIEFLDADVQAFAFTFG